MGRAKLKSVGEIFGKILKIWKTNIELPNCDLIKANNDAIEA